MWAAPRRRGGRALGVFASGGSLTLLVLSSALASAGSVDGPTGPASRAVVSGPATAVNLSLLGPGFDPTSYSREANVNDPECEHFDWTLNESAVGPGGPWVTVGISFENLNAVLWYGTGLSPGAEYWYVASAVDICVGFVASNVLEVLQPSVSELSFTQPGPTGAAFQWTNAATYGGTLAFSSYVLEERVNGGGWGVIRSFLSESSTAYTLSNLSLGTYYAFQVVTIDDYCTTCPGPNSTTNSSSNEVRFSTTQPVSVRTTSDRARADADEPVDFACSASFGTTPYSYSWTFSDGGTASGTSSSHTFSASGVGSGTCTVHDALGLEASALIEVELSPALNATIGSSASALGPGELLNLSLHPSGGSGALVSEQWRFGDRLGESGPAVDHRYSPPGRYTVSVAVIDTNGGRANASWIVLVSDPSVVLAVPATAGVTGQPFAFSASASGASGAPFTYFWTFGDGRTGTGPNPDHAFAHPGDYVVTVTASDAHGGANVSASSLVSVRYPGALGFVDSSAGLAAIGGGGAAGVIGLIVLRRSRSPSSGPERRVGSSNAATNGYEADLEDPR